MGNQLVHSTCTAAPPAATSEEDRVSFVLAQLRCGALRARHLACEVDAIGIALRGGMIPPDTAVAWLRDCGVLDDVASPQENTAMSACETCGNNPCVNPSFCAASRKADQEIGQRRLPNAPDTLPERPRPLMRELPSADPFPVEALGPVLAPAARAIHDRVQAPMALCGQSVLAAATLVVQAHADVELPIGGKRAKPLSSYFVTIAETGERKTEADYHALWAIRKHEKNLRDKYDAKKLDYENDKEAYEIARKTATKEADGNRLAAKAA